MSGDRDTILGGIRKSLKRGPLSAEQAARLEHRLKTHRANVIPARARVSGRRRTDLFVEEAERVSATVARVADAAGVPGAIASYLAEHNLPANLKVAPDPALKTIPWSEKPVLSVVEGRGEDSDAVSVTGAFAGVAETGTLVLVSGPEHPSTPRMPNTGSMLRMRGCSAPASPVRKLAKNGTSISLPLRSRTSVVTTNR